MQQYPFSFVFGCLVGGRGMSSRLGVNQEQINMALENT
jgi:hypothetical protein